MSDSFIEPFLIAFGFTFGLCLAGLLTCVLAVLGEKALTKLGVIK